LANIFHNFPRALLIFLNEDRSEPCRAPPGKGNAPVNLDVTEASVAPGETAPVSGLTKFLIVESLGASSESHYAPIGFLCADLAAEKSGE
jgi:hypothetical protein